MAREHEIMNNGGAELFVGNNYDYYKKQWENRIEGQSFVSWNWPAFLVPVYWLAYRRMYLGSFLCFLAELVLFCTCIGIVVPHIVMGLLGNYFYYRRGLNVISKTSHMSEYDAKVYIMKHGRTSIAAVIFIISMVLLCVFIRFINSVESLVAKSEVVIQEEVDSTSQLRLANEKTYDVTTKDGNITFTVPVDFVKKDLENQSLRCVSDSRALAFSAFVYPVKAISEDITEESVLELQVKEFEKHTKLTPLTKVDLPLIDDEAVQKMYYSIVDGDRIYFYFTCQRVGDYYVLAGTSAVPEEWEEAKYLYGDIVLTARLAAKTQTDTYKGGNV